MSLSIHCPARRRSPRAVLLCSKCSSCAQFAFVVLASCRDLCCLRRSLPAYPAMLDTRLDVPYGKAPAQRFDLFLPSGAASDRPLLVFVHGGAWRSGDKADVRDTLITRLAERTGHAVAAVNYRLSAKTPADRVDPPVRSKPRVRADVRRSRTPITSSTSSPRCNALSSGRTTDGGATTHRASS